MRRFACLTTIALAFCAGSSAAQTITVVNQGNVRPKALRRVERALVAQALQLRRFWHTPTLRFGAGGWDLYLKHGPTHDGGAIVYPTGAHYDNVLRIGVWRCVDSNDCVATSPYAFLALTPYAIVSTAGYRYPSWSAVFSHEVLETLADPYQQGTEVCDPAGHSGYELDGVHVSGFVTPRGRVYLGSHRVLPVAHEQRVLVQLRRRGIRS